MARALIELDGLRREFRRRRGVRLAAVDGVTLTVAPGEAVGLLGPYGAGKSTTIKMLTGILVPTTGRVRVCTFLAHANAAGGVTLLLTTHGHDFKSPRITERTVPLRHEHRA